MEYTDLLQTISPDMKTPSLEGANISGRLAVIYSRYGLGTEWDGQARPYALAYQSNDALRLGMNILIYAMTH